MKLENQLKLTYSSSVEQLCAVNSSFDAGVLKVAYVGKNRNGSSISKEAFERSIHTIYNLGAKAEFTSRIYLDPIELTLGTNASMSIANGHYRILEELDPYTLADLDRASLADLDFEEIDG